MEKIKIASWSLENGKIQHDTTVFYQLFGLPLGQAPVVLINHALTGNSNVCGTNGWWSEIIGKKKAINTDYFTVLAINIPGNGYDGELKNLLLSYRDFTTRDVANLFWKVLIELGINHLHTIIGGSLGGAIAWEMLLWRPNNISNLIPIATDWKTTNWVAANVFLQDKILNNSDDPIADARIHAMLLYRTPQSLNVKFEGLKATENFDFQIESWLAHHGQKLQNRFRLSAYKLMNHLLKTVGKNLTEQDFLTQVVQSDATIHIVSVNSDLFFLSSQNQQTALMLQKHKHNVFLHQIQSVHGHDAFLIEDDQLSDIISPIFEMVSY